MSHHRWQRVWQQGLLVALVLALVVTLIRPIWLTVRGGFASDPMLGTGWTLEHVLLIFKDPRLVEGLVNAFKIALGTTVLSILIALPLAIVSARCSFRGKKLWNALILVPLILPPFVGAVGVRAIMGRFGALNSILDTHFDFLGQARFWGVVLVEALHLYPIIYLNATASLANLDPALDEAAENLGASAWKRLWRITMPLIRPGLFAGATIVFIWSFTELGTPLMFEYRSVTPVQIFEGLKKVESSAEPYALTVVLLFSAVLMYAVGKFLFGGRAYAMYSKASRAASERPLSPIGTLLATLAFGVVTFAALVPHLGVVFTSIAETGQWYGTVLPTHYTSEHFQQALASPEASGSIINSLWYSLAAMILDIGIGVLVAYLIVRTKVRGRSLLDTLCMLPLAVPGLVMAFGYVAVTMRWPFGGTLEIGGLSIPPFMEGVVSVFGENPNPIPLLIIAYAVRRLPYIVRSAVAGLEQTSGELEEAAMNLGASRVTAVRRVILPLIMANLIAGGLLVFSFSMLEVSDSLILAQNADDWPITRAIYGFTERLGDGYSIASAMGVWGMALLTVTLVGASVLLGKRLGSIFRV